MDSELTLDEILAEPIVRLLMRRDGVDEHRLRALVEGIRRAAEDRARPGALKGRPSAPLG